MAQNKDKQLRRKVRTSYTISTVSIALVLFLLGTIGYLILTAASATDRMKESVTVNVMLADGVGAERIKALSASFDTMAQVRVAEFVSKTRAAAEFKNYIGSDFEEFLGENPLPDSFRVGMTSDASDRASLEAFEKLVQSWPEVDDVVYQRTVIEQITSNIRKFMLVLLFFGGTFLVIAIVLLNNTIRAAIYSRRYIINTMKLVGATRGFIMRPFLRESVWQGLFAALIAAAMFIGMVAAMNRGVADVVLMIRREELLIILAAMLLSGVIISLLFTAVAVNKFINMKTRHIHLY